MRQLLFALSALFAVTAAAASASARPFREQQLPAGAALGCNGCHNGNQLNPFGLVMEERFLSPGALSSADALWGPELAALDSDGDGATNGQELGDPEGTWLPGDPAPVSFSFPGFATCAELPAAERSGRRRGGSTAPQHRHPVARRRRRRGGAQVRADAAHARAARLARHAARDDIRRPLL